MSSKVKKNTSKNNGGKLGEKLDIERKFVHLARLALSGRQDDIAAITRQTLRRLESERGDLQTDIQAALSLADGAPTRRQLPTPPPVDVDSRLELLRSEQSVELRNEPLWPHAIRNALDSIVRERQKETELRDAGVGPSKSLLFVGPPGVGKTLAARWLARETGRPMFTLDLASVMNSFLGKTGANLRSIMDFAKKQRCVLLLDEFDALAKRRDDETEVGELKRLVTVLLQELDAWPDHSLLICATNHPELLDPAIWRRFDNILEFPKPSPDQIADLIRARLAPLALGQSALLVAQIISDSSFADVDRLVLNARRRAIVYDCSVEEALLETAAERATTAPLERRVTLGLRLIDMGWSQRQASELTGVARDTFRKHAAPNAEGKSKRSKRKGVA